MSARNDRRHMKKRKGNGTSKLTQKFDMPKNRQGKATQGQPKEQLQETPRPRTQGPIRGRIGKAISDHRIVSTLGLIGTLASIVGLPLAAWGVPWPVDPEIHAATDAYSTPFTIVNKSGWFSMTNVEVICDQGEVDYGKPNIHVGNNFSFRPIYMKDPIAPGGHATFACIGIPNLGPAISGTMNLGVGYIVRWHSHAVGKPRIIKAAETYVQGKWIDGPII